MRLRVWGLLLLLLLSGCGYSLPSRKAPAPDGATSYSIGVFTNKTSRMDLDTSVRRMLDEELAARQGLAVRSAGEGDREISGSILSFVRVPVSYTASDKVREYRATLTLEAVMRERATNRPLWRRTLTVYQDFPADANLALQFNREEAAIQELSRKMAREIWLHLRDDF